MADNIHIPDGLIMERDDSPDAPFIMELPRLTKGDDGQIEISKVQLMNCEDFQVAAMQGERNGQPDQAIILQMMTGSSGMFKLFGPKSARKLAEALKSVADMIEGGDLNKVNADHVKIDEEGKVTVEKANN